MSQPQKKMLPPLSQQALALKKGDIFEHYKQKRYEIVGVGRHSETLEEVVVYKALYGEGGIWVRPLAMFLETVVIDDRPVPRFRRISD